MTHSLAYFFIPIGTVLFWSFFNPLPSVTALCLCHLPSPASGGTFAFAIQALPFACKGEWLQAEGDKVCVAKCHAERSRSI